MKSFDSKRGKRYSRNKKRAEAIEELNKGSKPISFVAVFLLLFSMVLLVFFTRALRIANAEASRPSEYLAVVQAKRNLNAFEALTSYSHVYKLEESYDDSIDILGQDRQDDFHIIAKDPGVLKSDIKYYLRMNDIDFSQVGLVYYNLVDTTYMGHNEDERFFAASTSKMPVVMYLFDQAHNRDLDLNSQIMVEDKHMDQESGIIKEDGPGSIYSLYKLARLAITHSDNVATNMIYDFFGNYNGEYILDTLSRTYGISSYDGNYMTADDGAMLMTRFYNNEDKNPYYYDLNIFMKNTIYNNYFTKNINDRDIAHKTGDLNGYYNDIGIVYDNGGDYVFSCYTYGLENPEQVLNDLGQIVHEWHRGEN